MPQDCSVCFDPTPNTKPPVCDPCKTWKQYWESLTPAEQADEEASMAEYTGLDYG